MISLTEPCKILLLLLHRWELGVARGAALGGGGGGEEEGGRGITQLLRCLWQTAVTLSSLMKDSHGACYTRFTVHGTNCLNTQYASILRDVFVTHDMPAWGKSLFFQFAVLNKRNTQVYRVQYTWLYYF